MTTDHAAPDYTLEESLAINSAASRLIEQYAGVFGPETVERFVHESMAALTGSSVRQFVPLFAERFAGDRLRALAKVEGKMEREVPTVLFLCVQNAGRSQMASGWLSHLAGDRVEVLSGGSEPGEEVNPHAVAAMAEVGIDIASSFPKPWTDEIVRAADVVITMGCGDACPIYPGKRYEDWQVRDPKGEDLDTVRVVRDDIESRVRTLLGELKVEPVA